MSNPFFSIIVPAHNAENHIRNCLHSVKLQTFTDYELIVVLDNCTDNTAKVAMGYADVEIVTHYGRDGLARNAGLDAAEGEWVLFLDDDDWWIRNDVLGKVHHYAINTDADIMPFSFIWPFDKLGRYIWDHKKYRINIAPWSKAYRRSFIGKTRFSDEERTSDVPFVNELMWKNPKIYIIEEGPFYYYNYLRPGSQTEVYERER